MKTALQVFTSLPLRTPYVSHHFPTIFPDENRILPLRWVAQTASSLCIFRTSSGPSREIPWSCHGRAHPPVLEELDMGKIVFKKKRGDPRKFETLDAKIVFVCRS
jgi:hypothetical protein